MNNIKEYIIEKLKLSNNLHIQYDYKDDSICLLISYQYNKLDKKQDFIIFNPVKISLNDKKDKLIIKQIKTNKKIGDGFKVWDIKRDNNGYIYDDFENYDFFIYSVLIPYDEALNIINKVENNTTFDFEKEFKPKSKYIKQYNINAILGIEVSDADKKQTLPHTTLQTCSDEYEEIFKKIKKIYETVK